MADWSTTGLPPPLGDTYSIEDQDGTIRTSMDSGPPKLRYRFSATIRTIKASYFLSVSQKATLDAFYAANPVGQFNWVEPDAGATWSVRFASRPKYNRNNGLYWIASVVLEQLP